MSAGIKLRALSRPIASTTPTASESLEMRLHQAIDRNAFTVRYQPQAGTAGLNLTGFEALVRWSGEDGIPISPVDFIPLAEKTGLIIPLGELVLRTACQQASSWRRAGLIDVPVSVNLSALQLNDPALADTVFGVLDETGLPPSRLKLELTETALFHGTATARQTMMALHGAGIRFALDDFGTGYSSLSLLRQIPVETLKIDKSFVQTMTEDTDSAAIVNAIIALAHALHMQVVAEGVETREQLIYLRAYRSDHVQGYLMAPPLRTEDVAEFVQKNAARPRGGAGKGYGVPSPP